MRPYPLILTALLLGLFHAPMALAATCNPSAPPPPVLTQVGDCVLFANDEAQDAIDDAQDSVGDGVVLGSGLGATVATAAGAVVVNSGATANSLVQWGTQVAVMESSNALQQVGCTVWGAPTFPCPPPPLPWLPPAPPCVVPVTPSPLPVC